MKRKYAPKRRDRKTGESPYVKYNKAPYKYAHQSQKRRDGKDRD